MTEGDNVNLDIIEQSHIKILKVKFTLWQWCSSGGDTGLGKLTDTWQHFFLLAQLQEVRFGS